MAIGAEAAAILVPAMQIVAPVRTGQDDAPGGESGPQRVAIVGTVAEQMLTEPPTDGTRRTKGLRRCGVTRIFSVASASVTSVGDAAAMVIPRGIP